MIYGEPANEQAILNAYLGLFIRKHVATWWSYQSGLSDLKSHFSYLQDHFSYLLSCCQLSWYQLSFAAINLPVIGFPVIAIAVIDFTIIDFPVINFPVKFIIVIKYSLVTNN